MIRWFIALMNSLIQCSNLNRIKIFSQEWSIVFMYNRTKWLILINSNKINILFKDNNKTK